MCVKYPSHLVFNQNHRISFSYTTHFVFAIIEWTYFSIFVSPDSDDLYFELRKYGAAIEVVSPQKVRRRLRDEALAVISIYGETENPDPTT